VCNQTFTEKTAFDAHVKERSHNTKKRKIPSDVSKGIFIINNNYFFKKA